MQCDYTNIVFCFNAYVHIYQNLFNYGFVFKKKSITFHISSCQCCHYFIFNHYTFKYLFTTLLALNKIMINYFQIDYTFK